MTAVAKPKVVLASPEASVGGETAAAAIDKPPNPPAPEPIVKVQLQFELNAKPTTGPGLAEGISNSPPAIASLQTVSPDGRPPSS
jgi:hypothetical protein